ncbi:hypothetical protein ACU5AY_11500 [Rhizobium sp. PAMB 3174]
MARSVEELAQHPAFLAALAQWSSTCRTMFDSSPRLTLSMATHQRWLMIQAAYALYMEELHRSDDGFTLTDIKDLLMPLKVVSRNTLLAFIDELLAYQHILDVTPRGRRRPRRFAASEFSSYLLFLWYGANLASLDSMDGGARATTFLERPEVFCLAQPRMARNCLADERWRHPTERVGHFLWTVSGGLVVDEFMQKIGGTKPVDGHFDLGLVDVEDMASTFMISATHLRRILRNAIKAGLIGWQGTPNRSPMWISEAFVDEYRHWQAIKFHYVEEAFEWALAEPVVSNAARNTIYSALKNSDRPTSLNVAR